MATKNCFKTTKKTTAQKHVFTCLQVTNTEFVVLRRREELVSCIERDTNELMNDLRYFRDFVTTEYEASSDKVQKRAIKIHDFKRFTQELLNGGSASAVADVASILNQRASEIRAQSRKSAVGKRPSVDVIFQPLGLSCLSQAKNRRKINLVGRITASIVRTEVPQPELLPWSMQKLTTGFPTENTPKFPRPVFKFGASPPSVEDRPKTWRSGRQTKFPSFRFGASPPSDEDRPKTWRSGRQRVEDSSALKGSTPPSHSDYVIRQRNRLNEISDLSSSSDEDGFQNSDEDAGTQPAAEVVMENTSTAQNLSPDSVDDSSSASFTVLFSHKAKLRHFVGGSWRTRGVGNLEIVRLRDKNIIYLSMKNSQV